MKNQTDLLSEKGLPANLDAERLVLGSILLEEVYPQVADVLTADDFALEKHRRIFSAMKDLHTRGERIDRVTVANELMAHDQLECVDGLGYLVSLDDGLPQNHHLDAYVNIVHDKSTLRRAIYEHQLAINECVAAVDPTPEILERAERAIATLAAETRSLTFRTPTEVISRAGGFNEFLSPAKRRGVETPWRYLNGMLTGHGFTAGQMVVIGARPSMGKTALACQIADYAATHGTGVAFFTLEMPEDSILLRMAAARAEVDGLKISQGCTNQEERCAILKALAELTDEQGCRLWIDDTTGCTVPAMRAALRKLMARQIIGMVIIDYLQLVETIGGSARRFEQVSEISRGIKRMAREFSVPVVALAQIRRETERENRPPQLSDLRDSGSIEQDADIVLFPWKRPETSPQPDAFSVDLIIAKQRNGPLGKVLMKFIKRFAKFAEEG